MFVNKNLQKPNFHDGKSKRLLLDFFVISSWLQKSIRRWKIDDSMLYARELIESWFEKYIWKRIFIYVVEDIWLGNLYIWEIVLKNYKLFKQSETNDWFDSKYIYQAIYLLCVSSKNRENDSMICLVKMWYWEENERKFINEWCVGEIYNSNSKKVKENIEKFFNVEYKWYMNEKLYNYYFDCMMTLWDLNWWDWLCLYFINFYLIKKYKIGFDFYLDWKNTWLEEVKSKLNGFTLNFIDISWFKVEDYVYDKHTILWKKMWRWLKYFFETWSYLENEVIIWWNTYKEEIKKLIKDGLIND